jgi:hypothetical protein
MGLNESFMKYAKKGCNSGRNNPFFGKKHSAETKKIMSENLNHSFKQTQEYRDKVSKQCSGQGNPMYGKTVYETWVSKYGKEQADERYKKWIEKQRSNSTGSKNPMFGRPSPSGSGNGWKGWYKEWFFRSLKELSYVVNVLECNGDIWESAEFIQIPYINQQGVQRTYRPDFLVNSSLLVEVKPTQLKSSITVREKQTAAEEWCKQKNWTYILVDPPMLTDEQIKILHKTGLLQFTARYEELFKKRTSK